jgi:hypothetical protein
VTEPPDNNQPECRQLEPGDLGAIDALRPTYKRNALRDANYGWLKDAV